MGGPGGGGAGNSRSESQTQTTNQQITTSGASAEHSPTTSISAAGPVTYNDAGGEVSIKALQGMRDIVNAALAQQGNLNQSELQLLSDVARRNIEASVSSSDQSASLLSSVLKANNDLAANVQSGGAATAQKTTNYVIFGLIGITAIVALPLLLKK